jgi:hypothetical protein
MVFGTIEQAIADIRDGKFVIVADDEDRENEGDLVAAEKTRRLSRSEGGGVDLSGPAKRRRAWHATARNLDAYRTA